MSGNLAYKDEFYAFREELIGGKVVMMAPAGTNHTLISGNIHSIFWNYLKGRKCTPFSDGSTVYLTDEDHFVPDMMVICNPDIIKPDGIFGAPDLVVEVLSRSTMKNDKGHKKNVYAECGVKEYWLVSPGDKSVDVYRSNGSEFVFHNAYAYYSGSELAAMPEDERAAIETHFKCSLFDDLEISLEDVFYRTF